MLNINFLATKTDMIKTEIEIAHVYNLTHACTFLYTCKHSFGGGQAPYSQTVAALLRTNKVGPYKYLYIHNWVYVGFFYTSDLKANFSLSLCIFQSGIIFLFTQMHQPNAKSDPRVNELLRLF
jgi:hypothetical protein